MNDGNDSFLALVKDLRAECPNAAERIWGEFYQRLVQFADRKLGKLPRPIADGEDIASSAMHSLHVGLREGRFPDISCKDDLLKILFVIADRQAKNAIRQQRTQKAGGGLLQGQSALMGRNGDARGLDSMPGRDLASGYVDALTFECRELLDKLDDGRQRAIAVLRLQGYSIREIAMELEISTRMVDHKLARIREIWEPLQDDHLNS